MMSPDNHEIVWVFLHLRKAGGTTFGVHAAQHLVFDDTYISLSNWGRRYRQEHHRPGLFERDEQARRHIKLISGHQAYYGVHEQVPDKEPRYLTFVRDPVSRLISLYNYRRSTGRISESFDSWLDIQAETAHRNPMTKFYASRLFRVEEIADDPGENLRAALVMLERCWFVSATEFLDADLGPLFRAMGLPSTWSNMRVAGSSCNLPPSSGPLIHPAIHETLHRYVEPTEVWRERIAAEHPVDMTLYTAALQLRERTRAAMLQST